MADSVGKRKKRSTWNKEEVELFFCLWEEKLQQLRGVKRNSHVFKDKAAEMATKGHVYSANEIRVKIHNLTNKYRDERKSIGSLWRQPFDMGILP
ncbi:PREDICTED: uncharacterized protein LOC108975322 isoform X2 [Bactrocera latifrons]|uniref:uncharacterized protein LOC108975322 isoform X2 n=1 Tax=Bactrocera latifrons TaxID=174628 RepID=UPI0008DDC1B9|nr:PREDICTED: uncharacterized protein LOC108975322 isoform X2 [Bactrocera latifrons]